MMSGNKLATNLKRQGVSDHLLTYGKKVSKSMLRCRRHVDYFQKKLNVKVRH